MTSESEKAKLVGLTVPWSIAVDGAYLELHIDSGGFPTHITFVGCFPLHPVGDNAEVSVAIEPGPFRLARDDERASYHLVRVRFSGAVGSGWHDYYDEGEPLNFKNYDLSDFAGKFQEGQDLREYVERLRGLHRTTGISQDPGAYELLNSRTLKDNAPGRPDLHHYLYVGSGRILSIVAEGYEWELGQAVD